MSAKHCPDCGCIYGSPNTQLFCRDGGCDCHHESGVEESQDSGT